MEKTGIFLIAALMLCVCSLQASDGPGTTGAGMFNRGAGALDLGLGGGACALPRNVTGLTINPAAIGGSGGRLTASYDALPAGVEYNNVTVIRAAGVFTVGVSIALQDYGSITGTDNSGNLIGNVKASDQLGALTLAGKVFPGMTAGASVKYLRSQLAATTARTTALDAGLILELKDENMTIGFSVRNIGKGLTYVTEETPLPRKYRGGVAWHLGKVLFTGDVESAETGIQAVAGTEIQAMDFLMVRAGVASNKLLAGFFTFGAGVNVSGKCRLDYAFLPLGTLGTNHRISLVVAY